MRTITREEVRSHLFQAHHLVTPADSLPEAAGVCGFQNSPPGTWLCAAFNRLRSCSAWQLQQELDEGRGIMQAWSLRGAPWIFRFMMQRCIWMHFVQRKGSPGSIQRAALLSERNRCSFFGAVAGADAMPAGTGEGAGCVQAATGSGAGCCHASTHSRLPALSVAVCFSICERAAVWRGDCFLFCCGRLPFKGESPLDPDRRAHLHLQPFLTQLRKRAVSVMLRAAHWFAGFSMHTAPAM
mgnify:CR=1 FL=1